MNGSVVVKECDGEYSAIPSLYLSDASYTGSRHVVIDLTNGLENSTGFSIDDDFTAEDIADLLLEAE